MSPQCRQVCDFEQALISAVQTQLSDAVVVGCLFHWKKAVLRNMKRLRIPKVEATIAMKCGVLDILTVIDPKDIDPSGIVWVKQELKRRCEAAKVRYSTRKWRVFWKYFRKTWLQRYSPVVWNVRDIDKRVVARTNNPLERFNRELNKAFPTARPALPQFIETIKKLSHDYVKKLAAIAVGREPAPRREQIQLPKAPSLRDVGEDSESEASDEEEDTNEDPGDNADLTGSDDSDGNDKTGSEAAESDGNESEIEPDFSFDYERLEASESDDEGEEVVV